MKTETVANPKRKFFWSPSELKAAKTCIEKFSNINDAANYLAPKINRSVGTVVQQMYKIKNADNPKNVNKPKLQLESIKLPQGFNFELHPSKAVMYQDRITIYF